MLYSLFPAEAGSLLRVDCLQSCVHCGQVLVAEDCIGNKVSAAVKEMQPGQVLLLENTRFHKGEEKNDATFSKQVALMTK